MSLVGSAGAGVDNWASTFVSGHDWRFQSQSVHKREHSGCFFNGRQIDWSKDTANKLGRYGNTTYWFGGRKLQEYYIEYVAWGVVDQLDVPVKEGKTRGQALAGPRKRAAELLIGSATVMMKVEKSEEVDERDFDRVVEDLRKELKVERKAEGAGAEAGRVSLAVARMDASGVVYGSGLNAVRSGSPLVDRGLALGGRLAMGVVRGLVLNVAITMTPAAASLLLRVLLGTAGGGAGATMMALRVALLPARGVLAGGRLMIGA